jgi:hypothetical protein
MAHMREEEIMKMVKYTKNGTQPRRKTLAKEENPRQVEIPFHARRWQRCFLVAHPLPGLVGTTVQLVVR